MEQLVLTMSDVRFPAMRREVVCALASLADIDYQRRAWVGGEFSEPTVYEDLTMNINVLFDDTQVLPDPTQRLGTVLFAGDEVPALAALGASAIASLSQVFPQQMPDISQLLVLMIGVLALVAVVREPEPPTSLVDSRRKTPISQDRLHAGRGLIGVLVFGAAFLAGSDAAAMGPTVIALTLVLISNEIERIRRRR